MTWLGQPRDYTPRWHPRIVTAEEIAVWLPPIEDRLLLMGIDLGREQPAAARVQFARQLRVGPWHISVHRRAAARALELALLEQSSWFADWADLVWGNYRVHAAREMEHRDRIVRLRWE